MRPEVNLGLDLVAECDVVVIPCSSTKLDRPAKAEDFYCGVGYFRHQLKVAKLSGKPWYILSTKHGLLLPTDVIAPYSLIWSKKVQQDNKSMRGRVIPTATEEQRVQRSITARSALTGKKVLTFCSKHYEPYFPDWVFFNTAVGALVQNQNSKGIQFLVKTLHAIGEELDARDS